MKDPKHEKTPVASLQKTTGQPGAKKDELQSAHLEAGLSGSPELRRKQAAEHVRLMIAQTSQLQQLLARAYPELVSRQRAGGEFDALH